MGYYIATYNFKQTDRDGKPIKDNDGNFLPDIPVTHKLEGEEIPNDASIHAFVSPKVISGPIAIQEVSKEVYDKS